MAEEVAGKMCRPGGLRAGTDVMMRGTWRLRTVTMGEARGRRDGGCAFPLWYLPAGTLA